MNRKAVLITIVMLFAGIFFSYSVYKQMEKDISITISESDHSYEFSAKYNKEKTVKIEEHIRMTMTPDDSFSSVDGKAELTMHMNDGATLYITTSPGKLKVKIKKMAYSQKSVTHLKKMCGKLKSIIDE